MIEKRLVTKIELFEEDLVVENLPHDWGRSCHQNRTFEEDVAVENPPHDWQRSSSRGSILVTRSFSIMWPIFYSYIFFKRFYLGIWRALFLFSELIKLFPVLGIWRAISLIFGIYYQIDETGDTIPKMRDNPFHLSGRTLMTKSLKPL